MALTGTAALDLMEPALDLDQPIDLSAFNAPFGRPAPTTSGSAATRPRSTPTSPTRCCGFGLDVEGGKQMFVAARRMADPDALAAIRPDLPVSSPSASTTRWTASSRWSTPSSTATPPRA